LAMLLLIVIASLRLAHGQNGIVLWAHGRCATKTLMDTIKASGGLVYCRDRKETFRKPFPAASASALRECFGKTGLHLVSHARSPPHPPIPRGTAMHIKPMHLRNARAPLTDAPEALMRELGALGTIRLVVVVRRQNTLARLVSSYELMMGGAIPCES
jgi:hypothetical protein